MNLIPCIFAPHIALYIFHSMKQFKTRISHSAFLKIIKVFFKLCMFIYRASYWRINIYDHKIKSQTGPFPRDINASHSPETLL